MTDLFDQPEPAPEHFDPDGCANGCPDVVHIVYCGRPLCAWCYDEALIAKHGPEAIAGCAAAGGQ